MQDRFAEHCDANAEHVMPCAFSRVGQRWASAGFLGLLYMAAPYRRFFSATKRRPLEQGLQLGIGRVVDRNETLEVGNLAAL